MTHTVVRCPYEDDTGVECGRVCEDMDDLVDHISDDHDPIGDLLADATVEVVDGGEPA